MVSYPKTHRNVSFASKGEKSFHSLVQVKYVSFVHKPPGTQVQNDKVSHAFAEYGIVQNCKCNTLQ